jgi:hypothetical protein
MKCYNHPEVDAIGTCTVCGKAICQECSIDVSGKLVCKEDVAKGDTGRFIQTGTGTSKNTTNTLAIVSLILSVLGFAGCCCGGIPSLLFAIPAFITGWIARKQINSSEPKQEGMTLAILGMVFSIAEVVVAISYLLIWGTSTILGLLTNNIYIP